MAALKTEIKEENDEDRENENEIENEIAGENVDTTKKKKKKKKKKKNEANPDESGEKIGDGHDTEQTPENGVVENEEGEKKKKKRNRKKGGKVTQTNPPSIPIVDLFPDGVYPLGEEQEYPVSKDDRTATGRFTSEEKRALDRMHNDIYNEVRLAAEAHRQVSNSTYRRV